MLRCKTASSTEGVIECGVNSEIILKIWFENDLIDLQYHRIWIRVPTESQFFQYLLEKVGNFFHNLYGMIYHLCCIFW